MAARWTVLGSGSDGNASLLESGGAGLLVDAGLGPRQLASRFHDVGSHWSHIRAVLLTHTHHDHWHEKTLEKLLHLRIPLYCHAEHRRELQLRCNGFQELQFARLVHCYETGRDFSPFDGIRCRPLEVAHDGGPTFGFRLDGVADLFSRAWAIGYVADLGSWDDRTAQGLADVDVLAIEFNHDVDLQRSSGRAPWLIERVLSDHGHLSNVQGAQLLAACLRRSALGRLQHVVQLHLSRQCNRPSLAAAAARAVLNELDYAVMLQTAEQHIPGPTIEIGRIRSSAVA